MVFIQVITGQATDTEGLRHQFDRWNADLRPGATGFLGSTGGVTDDGRLVMLARFEPEEAARQNSERPEQGAWWAETEKRLERAAFHNSVEVTTVSGGGSNDGGFVQVMRGQVTDPDKLADLQARLSESEPAMKRHRPEILGQTIATHADGSYTNAVYFTSEAAAREGEAKEMPAELQPVFDELMSAITVEEYLDLKDPWIR
jgi:hypothetical protein